MGWRGLVNVKCSGVDDEVEFDLMPRFPGIIFPFQVLGCGGREGCKRHIKSRDVRRMKPRDVKR
jgi:hypothetical protein